MSDKPKPGGYIDREYLATAQRALGQTVDVASQLVANWNETPRGVQLLKLARMGVLLAELGEALSGMAVIRERWVASGKAVESGGECVV